MDKQQKTLKSPLSAKLDELKAKVAGEAQRSIAWEVLLGIEYAIIMARQAQGNQFAVEAKLIELKKFLQDFLKKPE